MKTVSMSIDLKDVFAGYGIDEVLKGISFSVRSCERWAIIGRNGTGKSTLIKLIAGLLHWNKGTLLVNGIDIGRYPARKRAQIMAYVPQKPDGIIPYSVHDFVMLGRYSAMGIFGVPSQQDREAVREAIDICDIRHLAERLMNTLSGGELQRVLLAGAVAQRTSILLLDEPTTFLDPAHERRFFEALARLHKKRDLTIVMVTHDINTALIQCTHIGALLNGDFVFAGTASEFKAKCPALLETVFGVRFERYECCGREADAFGAWEVPCQE
jgi:iron complex transport system ATP-binding protein